MLSLQTIEKQEKRQRLLYRIIIAIGIYLVLFTVLHIWSWFQTNETFEIFLNVFSGIGSLLLFFFTVWNYYTYTQGSKERVKELEEWKQEYGSVGIEHAHIQRSLEFHKKSSRTITWLTVLGVIANLLAVYANFFSLL